MHASWSRRRFVTHGLLPLAAAVPALVRAQHRAGTLARAPGKPPARSAPAVGAGNGPPAAPADGGSGSVRTTSAADHRLTTPLYINGRGPFHFLVDTGAERTLVAADVAARLALPSAGGVVVEGIIRRAPAVLVRIASLRMGTLVCPDLTVPVLPRSMLGVDGYLGLDVLDRHRVVFDFRARELTVSRPQGFFAAWWRHRDETIVHTLGSSGRLRATDCRVDGVRAAAFIDTGADVSVSNPALYRALLARRAAQRLPGMPVALYGITGGSLIGRAIDVATIRLGGLTWSHAPLVVAALQVFDVWGLTDTPALLLGMDCLERFRRVSIDYGRKELRFELAGAQRPRPLQQAAAGPCCALRS